MKYEEITTWEKACEVHSYDPKTLPDVSMLPEKFQKWLIANYKLGVITEAMNTDENGKVWTPDYSDWQQRKYFPYFEVEADAERPGGFAFSYSDYSDWFANSSVGSRLVFDTADKVYHIIEHFKELHLDQQLIR